ncbi:hypothetical protein DCAR_0312099 [Daucus carota subsp. sativus]|uniref:Uncharacterized protein n=1 Tax=Daucus carota subsp. sativus TaxID=79200 RepID=A0A169WB80_DAUCS|nr:PREDICTED: hevamine-A-like [Daucus carota subsp. sativus]WOG92822.1 hypothetical protein DCAR_0312099 [Daucus carota subsp. sativus]
MLPLTAAPSRAPRFLLARAMSSKSSLFWWRVGSETSMSSPADAKQVANYLYNNFLDGQSASRPFGSVILDGVDFDMSDFERKGIRLYYDDLARDLSGFSTQQRKVYLSAAPQCPIPDAKLDAAIQTGLFDYVWIQFYNNPQCHYTGTATNLLARWRQWAAATPSRSQIFLGLPAARLHHAVGSFLDYQRCDSITQSDLSWITSDYCSST